MREKNQLPALLQCYKKCLVFKNKYEICKEAGKRDLYIGKKADNSNFI